MAVLDRWLPASSPPAFPDTPLGVVLKGALAGIMGTLALGTAMKGAQWAVRWRDGDGDGSGGASESPAGIGASEALAGTQVQAPFLDESTELFVQKVATGLFGASLSGSARAAAGVATHFAYGGFWGAVYGVLQSSLRLPAALHGPLYGLIVWLIGPATLVPAMGIMPPLQRQGTRRALLVAGFHLAYGLGLGLTFEACAGRERRR
jgi:hypothetical protein